MFWCSEPYGHAFYLISEWSDPRAQDKNQRPWIFIGHHREVFSSASEGSPIEIHYAGTYICKMLGCLSASEYMLYSKDVRTVPSLVTGKRLRGGGLTNSWFQLRDELCQEVISRQNHTRKKGSENQLDAINRSYQDGTRKISFLFLQCVGFNRQLYQTLRHEFKESKHLKRPLDNPTEEGKKRIRIESYD